MAGRRRTVGIIAGVVVLVLAGGAFAGWWFLVRDDAPGEADIETAGETLDDGAGDAVAQDGIDGSWAVDTSVGSFDDFSGTWAGYRFREELAGIGANTAVGRTPDVSGTMTIVGDAVTAVDVEVDVTTLKSDSGTRDAALGARGLETDRFPTARFSLTEPVALPAGVGSGAPVGAEATGELTVHGVTRPVTVTVDARLEGATAAVVGRAPVALADYDIDPPTGFSVLSVEDEGTFEFQIFFAKT